MNMAQEGPSECAGPCSSSQRTSTATNDITSVVTTNWCWFFEVSTDTLGFSKSVDKHPTHLRTPAVNSHPAHHEPSLQVSLSHRQNHKQGDQCWGVPIRQNQGSVVQKQSCSAHEQFPLNGVHHITTHLVDLVDLFQHFFKNLCSIATIQMHLNITDDTQWGTSDFITSWWNNSSSHSSGPALPDNATTSCVAISLAVVTSFSSGGWTQSGVTDTFDGVGEWQEMQHPTSHHQRHHLASTWSWHYPDQCFSFYHNINPRVVEKGRTIWNHAVERNSVVCNLFQTQFSMMSKPLIVKFLMGNSNSIRQRRGVQTSIEWTRSTWCIIWVLMGTGGRCWWLLRLRAWGTKLKAASVDDVQGHFLRTMEVIS